MPNERTTDELPRPFYDDWPRSLIDDAHALWNWHSSLKAPQAIGGNGTRMTVDAFFEEERQRACAGEPMRLLRETVWKDAYRACERHDLDRNLLAEQVRAAQQLQGGVRFDSTGPLESFVRAWAVPHARLLAGLAEVDNSWQVRHVDELARGFFHAGRLITLPGDLDRGRLFVPISDLKQSDVSIDQLRNGSVNENVRRLLWKQTIRVRDALAQGKPLIKDLPFRQRFALKRWWLGTLETLNELERRDYDLWSRPLHLGWVRRVQVYLQTLFGRASTA